MAIKRLNVEIYSDVAYVEGVYKHDTEMERALYDYCKRYFDSYYRGVFFVDDIYKMEIFQDAFIKLWENIENRKIYVDNGVLKGKDKKEFTSTLTTYFMGIAKLKYKEWVREHSIEEDGNEEQLKKADTKIAKHLLYDDGQEAMLEIIADCLSHMPERCNQIITMFYYEEKGLDDIIKELQTFESKNALKTAKYKCMENLRKAVREIYYRHVNT